MPSSDQMLHPPRLAPIFAASPSAPGTPVHSIQTVRRKAAGHSGPLTKILVANRGVSPPTASSKSPNLTRPTPRKSRSVFFVRPMNWLCIQLPSILLKIASLLIVKRSVRFSFIHHVQIISRTRICRRMRLTKWGRVSHQLRRISLRTT